MEDEGDGDEDIFGKRPSMKGSISFELPSKSDGVKGGKEAEDGVEEPLSTAKKRSKIPQQILDNKAVSYISRVIHEKLTRRSSENRLYCCLNQVVIRGITSSSRSYSVWSQRELTLLS
jgi:hypothetical protein